MADGCRHFGYPYERKGLRRRVALWLLGKPERPQVRGKIEPTLSRQRAYAIAPAVGNAVLLLPLVDSVPAKLVAPGQIQQRVKILGDLLAAAERVDQVCVCRGHGRSIGEILRLVNPEICEDDMEALTQQNPVMGQKVKKQRDVECGRRLRLVRGALGFRTMRAFAEHMLAPMDDGELAAKESLYGKWERGEHMVPFEFAEQLKLRYRVTTDYIYFGDMAGLADDLRAKLILAERHEKAH